MRHRFVFASLLGVLLLCTAARSAAQTNPPVVGVRGSQLIDFSTGTVLDDYNTYIESEDDIAFFNHVVASPGGRYVAYALSAFGLESQTSALNVVDRTNGSIARLSDDADLVYPPTFSPDAQFVYYAIPIEGDLTETRSDFPQQPMQIFRHTLPAGPPEALATFTYGVGCGGGSPDPRDGYYTSETGLGGSAMLFQALGDGRLLHSVNCDGTGLALATPQQARMIVEGRRQGSVARGVLAADGTQVAGLTDLQPPALAVVTLASGELRRIDTTAPPDQVAWGPDGRLYYSVRTRNANGTPDVLTDDTYDVAIYLVDETEGTEDVAIYTAPGVWGIPRMVATQDTLYFNQIPGTPTLAEDFSNFEQVEQATRPDVFALPLNGGAASQVAGDVELFTLLR
jgi:hypothetical protein